MDTQFMLFGSHCIVKREELLTLLVEILDSVCYIRSILLHGHLNSEDSPLRDSLVHFVTRSQDGCVCVVSYPSYVRHLSQLTLRTLR